MTESRPKADLVRRLKSTEGHLRGIQRLLDNDATCLDVARQIVAVQRALERVSGLVLDRHLRRCVKDAVWAADEEARRRALEEFLELVELIR